jgi:RNA-directed DNA polymerase
MSDIIKAQQGLARKALTEPTHQFKDLYFLLCKREWIASALQRVLSNQGARSPGIDGMTVFKFDDPDKSQSENDLYREHFITQIQTELKTAKFRPSPVREVLIPKPSSPNKKRPLGIRTIKDRVVATLLKMVLEPIWESDFLYFSNGFRPGRCTMDCVEPLYTFGNAALNYRWIIEGDIQNCFGAIPHQKLMLEVKRRIADWRILKLINHFLKSGIMRRKKFAPSEEGVSQGDPLSPLLANIYLSRFDEWFKAHYQGPDCKTEPKEYKKWIRQREKGKTLAAAQMFRYADDWIMLVKGTKVQAQAIKQTCQVFLKEELGLELSEAKTKLTHFKQGFTFLGYHIFYNPKPANRRRRGVFVLPAKANFKRIRQKIREMTNSSTLNDDYLSKLQALNAVLRGWANYYRAVNPRAIFKKLDNFVWHRLYGWLATKFKSSSKKIRRDYQHRRPSPKGSVSQFSTLDESTGKMIYCYQAVDTKLVYYRPRIKKYWPNPYLEEVKIEHYELPNLKAMWNGQHDSAEYQANRRQVIGRAGGQCERCGEQAKLEVHHKHRVGGKGKLKKADNRVEMLEALCEKCHNLEHRAENINRAKLMRESTRKKTG